MKIIIYKRNTMLKLFMEMINGLLSYYSTRLIEYLISKLSGIHIYLGLIDWLIDWFQNLFIVVL